MPRAAPGTDTRNLPRDAGAFGTATVKSSVAAVFVLESKTVHTPPPPSPAADGNVTLRAKYIAIAASIALPPADNASRPICTALGSSAAMPP
jgi:hypothetical protein